MFEKENQQINLQYAIKLNSTNQPKLCKQRVFFFLDIYANDFVYLMQKF